ncbi:MAG: Sporulation protease LonB, partial [Verrucomicrobiales bacterium]|nr:Sporulation protease LonB [Verrucomicrobiales bacterium]
FSPEYTWLVAVDEAGGGKPDIVRVCQRLTEGVALARELAQRAAGTKWQLDGPEKFVIRFDSTAQMTWVDGAGTARGGSFIRPFPEDGKVRVASWQGVPATVTLAASMTTLELNADGKIWKGTFISREPSEDFSALGAASALASTDTDSKKTSSTSGDAKKPADATPAEMALGTSGLKSRTCRMNGLLVAVLPNGRTAGATSQMNAIALPDPNRNEASLRFNQETGGQMEKSLEEVRKYLTLRQGSWPKGYAIEISFADKYTPKDGPSAAVACGLLLEGLYTDTTWDPAVAVTGDMNSDGSVQPVGGVPAKIRGAAAKQCRIVGIPAANERAVRDLMISEGPATLVTINIFGMKEFSQARDLAVTQRPAALAGALTEYDKIIKAAPPGPQLAAWLKLPGVVGQLRKVVAAAPHHISAKLLLEFAEARGPQSMSLAGSLEAIDFEAGDLMDAVKSSIGSMGLSGIKEDKLGDAVFRLSRIRAKMHPETRPLLDSIENFSKVVRGFLNNPPNSAAYANKAVEAIQTASSKVSQAERALKSKPEVVAELMRN